MNPEKIMLDGGGTLLSICTDRFKTETLTILYPMPFSQRNYRLGAILLSIMKRGCRCYPDIASLSRHLDDLYDANISTMGVPLGDNFLLGFACESLDMACIPEGEDLMKGTLETLYMMLYDPLVDAEGLFSRKLLELEKRNLCDSVRAAQKDPRTRSFQLCREIMFEGEPYGRRAVGSIEEVMAVSGRELADFYSEFIENFDPMFVYVGRRDAKSVSALINDILPSRNGRSSALHRTIIKQAPGSIRHAEEAMPVLQGKLAMGFRSDIDIHDEDFYAAVIFNDIFGGSPSSKLFRNVREKQSLCYSCSSNYDYLKGSIFVRSGISNENKDRVIDEILKQFEAIKAGDVSDYEFNCAKGSIENFYRQAGDSAYSLESYYRTRLIEGVSTTLEKDIEKLCAVTKEDVIRVANRFGADTCAFIRGTLSGNTDDVGDEYADDEE